MVSRITQRLAILFLTVAAASTLVVAAHATFVLPEGTVAVVAQPFEGGQSGGSGGEITVFLPLPPEGFSDGGDVPEGMVAAVADQAEGFSDGGDVPEGLVAVLGVPAPEGFSDGGDVPEGMIAVLAQPAEGGGVVPEGEVAVLLEPLPESQSFSPPGG
jgi:hypothetical protein